MDMLKISERRFIGEIVLEGKQTPQCINEEDFKLGKYK